MSKDLLASIIINNYNYGRFLAEAIESALNQTYANTEVIVVDDGSTDNSREIIAKYDSRVIPVLKENGGQASAFNSGFGASNGDIVIFLDSDDTLLPMAVKEVVKLFEDSNVVKVHYPLWAVDANGEKTGKVIPGDNLIEGDLRELAISYGPSAYDIPPYSPPTSGNAWSRKFLNQVLPMPESQYKTGADTYLLMLALIYGSVRKLFEPQGCYRNHGSNDTLKPLEEYISDSLPRHEYNCVVLSKHLRKMGVDVTPMTWKRDSWWHRINSAIKEITELIPPNGAFILVDDNQWRTDEIVSSRRRIPFLEKDGQYWGAPPDDETAIRELERLRQSGANFMVFAWTAFWWLDYYTELRQYLRSKFRCILENDRMIVFDLRL